MSPCCRSSCIAGWRRRYDLVEEFIDDFNHVVSMPSSPHPLVWLNRTSVVSTGAG